MKRFFISFSVCLFCLLSACSGDSSASETISTYSFGEDTIPALEQVMTEQSGGRLTAVLSPESTAGDDAGTDDGNAERTDSAGNEADATSPTSLTTISNSLNIRPVLSCAPMSIF